MQEKILITGNCNRKIWNSKAGTVLKCASSAEAHTIRCMADKMGVKARQRNAQLVFESEIDREKYLWVSGEPKKSNVKPSLGSVE